jgi:hypothetical protein
MNIGKYYREIRGVLTEGQKIFSMPVLGGLIHKPEDILQQIREVER